jgi:hypothetical protein
VGDSGPREAFTANGVRDEVAISNPIELVADREVSDAVDLRRPLVVPTDDERNVRIGAQVSNTISSSSLTAKPTTAACRAPPGATDA